jgi:hypothetical protein
MSSGCLSFAFLKTDRCELLICPEEHCSRAQKHSHKEKRRNGGYKVQKLARLVYSVLTILLPVHLYGVYYEWV